MDIVKPLKLGKTTRMSFSKIDHIIDIPNLIDRKKLLVEIKK
jgi:hypothetical protein